MGHSPKVVTCCYCGSRAALVLTGKVQHELACGRCGAPLHELKSFPVNASRRPRAAEPHRNKYRKQKKKDKDRKRKASYSRKAMSEIFDVIEDLFD